MRKFSSKLFSFNKFQFSSRNIISEQSNQIPSQLKPESFLKRHIGSYNSKDTNEMLKEVKSQSMDEFINSTVPSHIQFTKEEVAEFDNKLKESISESSALEYIEALSKKNKIFKTYIGEGFHPTFIPPVILRNLLENPGWYTSYTPYQSEISQGRLESLFNFQTLIAELTGLPYANASLLDEATAASEAMYIANSFHNGKRRKFFVLKDVFKFIKEVIYTRANYLDIEIIEGDIDSLNKINFEDFSGILIQNPNSNGAIIDYSHITLKAKTSNCLSISINDPLSLMIIKSPADMGFDISVGNTQRFGVPMMNGGPHAGFLAVKEDLNRKMPGRVIGLSVDSNGKPAFRLALQTREQHIKREKATSNICTAQALLANIASFYAIFHGKEGLKSIANRVYMLTYILSSGLKSQGYEIVNNSSIIFDTILIKDKEAEQIYEKFIKNEINLRKIDKNHLSISLNETVTVEDIQDLLDLFSEAKNKSKLKLDFNTSKTYENYLSSDLQRKSSFLKQTVFNNYTSETQIMRYLNHLQSKDYSLVHGMIPLGSCTLKLNSAAELIPVTWKLFSNIHPFAPNSQKEGYQILINELCEKLKVITSMDGVSLQPNSGANGEYAGLLAIRRYLDSIGETKRNLVFIPASAHGTNPASAAICGLKVVVIASDKNGNTSVDDFKSKLEKHKNEIACAMITYPSTHGVFEDSIKELSDLVHKAGGQVYIDGANMNAQVGITSPGILGGDVCHLNLHKTFSIPHGGGGPGVGPICVKKHLIDFLPGHIEISEKEKSYAVSSAQFGSAGILPISYMYISMCGKNLRKNTEYSILNANYLASRLSKHYNILYTGKNGRCGHEFIIDIRPIKASSGITEEDIAKRLIDYSFHPPTMSWPVGGTLMIEPTESEDKAELDRFVEALISIREEIREVETGKVDKENNVLKHSPHTMEVIMSDKWDRPYSREKAAFPVKSLRNNKKHWPTVGRVNNVYGDKNLICTCPSLDNYI